MTITTLIAVVVFMAIPAILHLEHLVSSGWRMIDLQNFALGLLVVSLQAGGWFFIEEEPSVASDLGSVVFAFTTLVQMIWSAWIFCCDYFGYDIFASTK